MNRGGSAPCAGLPPTPTGSGFGLSANLASATLGYSALGTTVANASPTPVVVAGGLVGAMPACDAFVKQLPRATPGSLGLAGTPTALTFAALGGTRLRVPGRTLYPRADGSCSPQASVLPGTRHTSVCDFRNVVVGAALIKVQFMGGVVTTFTAFTAISASSASGKACHCDTGGSMFMAKCEGRMRVSADGRTLTFNDFKAGLGDAPTATGSFTGNAVVVGLLRLQLATGTPATASRCKPSPTPPATSRTSVWA